MKVKTIFKTDTSGKKNAQQGKYLVHIIGTVDASRIIRFGLIIFLLSMEQGTGKEQQGTGKEPVPSRHRLFQNSNAGLEGNQKEN